jgi:hypothetical protein
MMMKRCNSYVGVACIDGHCPNALRNEDIEEYKDIYGTTRKQRCDYCGYNEGCKDCAMPEMEGITEQECRRRCNYENG